MRMPSRHALALALVLPAIHAWSGRSEAVDAQGLRSKVFEIKRLDRPSPPRADIELKLHVLLASGDAATPTDGWAPSHPDDLKVVLAPLKSTLSYKSYKLVGSFVQRTQENASNMSGGGQVGGKNGDGSSLFIRYSVSKVELERGEGGQPKVKLEGFGFYADPEGGKEVGLRTDVGARENEKVVVGTSMLGNTGIIVVVSASVLK